MSLLQYLKDENILELFLINYSNRSINLNINRDKFSIGNSFEWMSTPEGHAFWNTNAVKCPEYLTNTELEYLKEHYPEHFI